MEEKTILAVALMLLAGLACGQDTLHNEFASRLGLRHPDPLLEKLPKSALSEPVQQLCDDFWNWKITDMPEFATFVGIHDYNELLDDLSLYAYDERLEAVEQFMWRIVDLEITLVDHADIINVKVLKDELQTYIDGFPFKNFLQPINYLEGPPQDLMRVLSWMPLESYPNYETLLARLGNVQTHLLQIEILMREGAQLGVIPHAVSMAGVAESMEKFVVANPEDNPIFQEFFVTFSANITEGDAVELQASARAVIEQQIVPAFHSLREYIMNEYPSRPDIAVTTLPNGHQLYNQLIKFHAGDTVTPEEIHQKGLEEVDRISGLMQEIVYEMGYDMPTQNFSEMIEADPSNYYDTADELMGGFENIVYNIATPALPQAFMNIPKAELVLVEDPSPDGTMAFYLSGSYDGSRPGVFYVNTYDPHSTPKYEMLTLSLHEGNPGHHLQGAHSLESNTYPFFRRVSDDRNYGHAPSSLPLRTYFIEGWGLYAESVGFDMDLFQDPLDRYGHYSHEMFRACRLVVDTGLHVMGWTIDQAVEFMLLNTAMTRLAVENEVNRYITWPGQALGYKWGELQFRQIRADAEQKLGDKFDIKEYHEVLLETVGPMSLVQEEVNTWVESVLARKQ